MPRGRETGGLAISLDLKIHTYFLLQSCVFSGRHKQHKGRAKHYLNPEEVREQEEKKKREDEWRVR